MSDAGPSRQFGSALYNAESKEPQHGFAPSPAAGLFDIFEWHPAHESCQRYFLDCAQYDNSVKAVCALINITLPHQWSNYPLRTATPTAPSASAQTPTSQFSYFQRPTAAPPAAPPLQTQSIRWVSLVPYIRRLIVTGFDRDAVMHGFFGDDWRKGVGPVQECERRNYLFAAKSGGWLKVKSEYDMGPQETVPFLQPPQNVQLSEIENAEKLWSQWLAMEDWVIGSRAPGPMEDYSRNAVQSSDSARPT